MKGITGTPMPAALHFLALTLMFCISNTAAAQPRDNSRFVIFIHTGGGTITEEQAKAIAVDLVRKRYTVRVPDNQQDRVGGPGVDYFADDAKGAADDVAATVNAAMKSLNLRNSKPLAARRQNLKNPPGFLGVWLF
jgi:hypothetical protein